MRAVKLFLKILWTMVLIAVCTAAIMGFFMYKYITGTIMPSEKTNINLDTMPVNLSSRLYFLDPDTGEYKEYAVLQNAENREWREYNEIPKDFVNAFVAIEDERFWTHPGIDIKRTVAAGLNFMTGKTVFGGSTITQQLVKNLSGDNQVTINRKIMEICRAIKLEQNYDKTQILEWYLNIIYFGSGQYGIQMASKYYFDKSPEELNLAEIACITGITNNPSRYNPYNHPENNLKRRNLILDKMLELGYISQAQHDEYHDYVITPATHSDKQKSGSIVYPYYIDAVIEDVIAEFQSDYSVSREQATNMLYYGGYEIYTCVNPDIQAKLDTFYSNPENIPKTLDNKNLQSAMVIVDPSNGDILAMAGGVGEKNISRGLNWATSKLARRPPGSSFKPIAVYAPAMNLDLISPYSNLIDSDKIKLSGTSWLPQNDNRKYSGIITIHDAVIKSVNTIAAQVMDLLGPENSYQFLTEKLGLNLEPQDCDYAPLALGQLSIGTTVREMAQAYTIFPTMGICRRARTFNLIKDHDGNIIYQDDAIGEVVISQSTAYYMTEILTHAVQYGTGSGARLAKMPAAGKTGTSTNAKDRWFVGFTPYYIGAVWTGYEKPSRMRVSGNPASKIWKQVMESVHEDLEIKDFTKPEDLTYPGPKPVTKPADEDVNNNDGGITPGPEQSLPPDIILPGNQEVIQDPDYPESGFIIIQPEVQPEVDPDAGIQTDPEVQMPPEPSQTPAPPIVIEPVIPETPVIPEPTEPVIPVIPETPAYPQAPEIIIPPGMHIDPWTMEPVPN